ncbi:MAG: NAD(P)/FAD-dependent oxidoreductase [Chloroflexi bacterium]|nr:NAD(P)/FAD-dependent oxidoreductase [Chloroflexota bacterium]
MRLTNGSRVVIVGGGPAGSFAALHLLRFAAQANLTLEIVIFEARDFNRPGPGGCNKCAGILSSTLVANLETLDLELPAEVIQAELNAYVLHSGEAEILLHRPNSGRRSLSVYRGSGPRLGTSPTPHSFDSWLLNQARERGAQIRRGRVQTIARSEHPVVATAHEKLEADLVVLATGVNSRAPLDAAWHYQPPQTEMMAQDEIPMPGGFLTDRVHIFFDHPQELIFGGLIPKGRYANISLLGRGLPPDAISDFLEGNKLTKFFPEGTPALCGCTPRIAISAAPKFYDERLVIVGDAAVTRLYKDGIGAAFTTAEAAARTAVQRGISRRDFASGYRPTHQQITTDNLYGQFLFRIWAATRRSPFLLNAWRRAILSEVDLPKANQIHARVLWGMFTGDESYQKIFQLSLSCPALRALWQGALKDWRGK